MKQKLMQAWRWIGLVIGGALYLGILWYYLSRLEDSLWQGLAINAFLLAGFALYWFSYARYASSAKAMLFHLGGVLLVVIVMAFSKHPLIVMIYALASLQSILLSLLLVMRPKPSAKSTAFPSANGSTSNASSP